jgi:hypothetical protein
LSRARSLNDILLNIGGSKLDEAWGNFTDSRVADFLSEHGKEFSTERPGMLEGNSVSWLA